MRRKNEKRLHGQNNRPNIVIPARVIAGLLLLTAAAPGAAATYQCDNYVVTENPGDFTGCVNVETGEAYRGEAARFEGMDRFSDVSSMLNALSRFKEGDGTLVVQQDQPLHIQLHPRIWAREPYNNKVGIVQRALVHGVYRAFAHTPIERLTVEVVPRKMDNRRLQHKFRKVTTVDRERALQVIRRHVDVEALSELVTTRAIGEIESRNQWVEPFAKIYHEAPPWRSLRSVIASLQL